MFCKKYEERGWKPSSLCIIFDIGSSPVRMYEKNIAVCEYDSDIVQKCYVMSPIEDSGHIHMQLCMEHLVEECQEHGQTMQFQIGEFAKSHVRIGKTLVSCPTSEAHLKAEALEAKRIQSQ